MIEKYQKLTSDDSSHRKELEEMEAKLEKRIEEIHSEEALMELDVDKVIDYLLNLIAYLDEDGQVDKSGKMVRRNMMKSKDLLKKRFTEAGLSSDQTLTRKYSYKDVDSKRTGYKSREKYQSMSIQAKKSSESQEGDAKEKGSRSPIKSAFSQKSPRKQPNSMNLAMEPLQNRRSKAGRHADYQYDVEYRKLKIEDLDDETAELIFKALDDVKEIKENKVEKAIIEEAIQDMKSEFEKEKEILIAKFESNRIHLQKYVENVQKDLEEELIKRNREKANVNMKLNGLEAKVSDLRKKFGEHEDAFDNLSETVNYLVETTQINHAMELQDEIDREKLALMGYKEEKSDGKAATTKPKSKATESNNPYVTLDKQCLTCSGQSSVVLKAFKIACLTYKPSPVAFPEQTLQSYSRLDLINLKGKMLKYMEKIPLTKAMRDGSDPENERMKLFNQYMHFTLNKTQQKDVLTNSLFHSRHPKITIRSDTLSNNEFTSPMSPQEIKRKNITLLSEKSESLSRNPLNEASSKRLKKKRDSLKELVGPQAMSLPQIRRGNQTTR